MHNFNDKKENVLNPGATPKWLALCFFYCFLYTKDNDYCLRLDTMTIKWINVTVNNCLIMYISVDVSQSK